MDDKLKHLYEVLSKDSHYTGIGSSYEEFKKAMSDNKVNERVYNALSKDSRYTGIGSDVTAFREGLGLKKKEEIYPSEYTYPSIGNGLSQQESPKTTLREYLNRNKVSLSQLGYSENMNINRYLRPEEEQELNIRVNKFRDKQYEKGMYYEPKTGKVLLGHQLVNEESVPTVYDKEGNLVSIDKGGQGILTSITKSTAGSIGSFLRAIDNISPFTVSSKAVEQHQEKKKKEELSKPENEARKIWESIHDKKKDESERSLVGLAAKKYEDIAEHNEPGTVIERILGSTAGVLTDIALSNAIMPEIMLPDYLSVIPSITKIPKFALYKGLEEGINKEGNLKEKTKKGSEAYMNMLLYEGMGAMGGKFGDLFKSIQGGQVLNPTMSALATSTLFTGEAAAREYMETGKITPENLQVAFGTGLAISASPIFEWSIYEGIPLLYEKANTTFYMSSKKMINTVSQMDIKPAELLKESIELGEKISKEKDPDRRTQLIVAKNILDNTRNLYAMVHTIAENPIVFIDNIKNDKSLNSAEKQLYLDKINEVIKNTGEFKEANKIQENINKLQQEVNNWESQEKSLGKDVVEAKTKGLKKEISENKKSLDNLFNKPEEKVDITGKLKEETLKERDKLIEEKQKKLNLETIPEIYITDNTNETLDKFDKNEPVINDRLKEASDNLYKEYKRLEKEKEFLNKNYTTKQIQSLQKYLEDNITKLNNLYNKQAEEGKFKTEIEENNRINKEIENNQLKIKNNETTNEIKKETEKPQPVQEQINEKPQDNTKKEETEIRQDEKKKLTFKEKFKNIFKKKGNVTDEQADAVIKIMDARANSWASEKEGRKAEDWFNNLDVGEGEFKKGTKRKHQLPDGRQVETMLKGSIYSNAEKAVNNATINKGTKQQWKKELLRNGAKESELEYMGFDELSEKLTKEDVNTWVNENKIELEEIVNTGDNTKYSAYTTKNGKNYKEYLITKRSDSPELKLQKYLNKLKEKYNTSNIYELEKKITEDENRIWAELGTKGAKDKDVYRSEHFDTPNVVLHLRTTENIDNKGNKVLVIEEVQSDWAQQGREKGFKTKDISWDSNLGKKVVASLKDMNNLGFSSWEKAADAIIKDNDWVNTFPIEHKYVQNIAEWRDNVLNISKVPNMPFKKTSQWVRLGLRRMVKEAVDNGFDKVAWTTGEQQAERYDLSKQVDKIKAFYDINGTYGFDAYKDGEKIISKDKLSAKELKNNIGKELSEKIIKDSEQYKGQSNEVSKGYFVDGYVVGEYQGKDLKVGGEGMKGFYDNIIPKEISKIFKKYDVKVETSALNKEGEVSVVKQGNEWLVFNNKETQIFETEKEAKKYASELEGIKVHSFDITPKLREAVKKGMPMFQKEKGKDAKGAVEIMEDGKIIIHALKAPDVSTMIHEVAHVFEKDLTKQEQKIVNDYGGSEKFARGFERYLRTGKAPTPELKTIFDKFKVWLTNIYKTIKGSPIEKEITPEIKSIYDRLLVDKPIIKEKEVQEKEPTTPQEQRDAGYKIVNGHKVERQSVTKGIEGKEIELQFSDNISKKGKITVVEADKVQASHINKTRNPKHFIPETQPKERTDIVNEGASKKIADNLDTEKIGDKTTNVYLGMPTVNERLEVIQGNNRTRGIQKYYEGEKTDAIKKYIIDNAERLGFDKEAVQKIKEMKNPMLVNKLDVSDNEAIELGQYKASDIETGGKQRIEAKETVRKAGDKIDRLIDIITKSDEDLPIRTLIRKNVLDALKYMQHHKIINDTQYNSAFKSNGEIKKEIIADIEEILTYNLFREGRADLDALFENIPYTTQNALIKSSHLSKNRDNGLNNEIQTAIQAYNEYKYSKIDRVEDWKVSADMYNNGLTPEQSYGKHIIKLVELFKDAKTNELVSMFKNYNRLIEGEEGIFPIKPISKKEAFKQIFKTDIDENTGISKQIESNSFKETINNTGVKPTSKETPVKENGRSIKSEKEKEKTKKEDDNLSSVGADNIDNFQPRNKGSKVEPFNMWRRVVDIIKKHAPQSKIIQGYTGRKALGKYNTLTKNIKLKGLNDISVAIHETTHAIDKANDIIKNLDSNLKSQLKSVYLEYYPNAKDSHKKSLQHTEGLAMFVEKYIEQPTIIKVKYPELVNKLIDNNIIPSEFINDVEQLVNDYQGSSSFMKMQSKMAGELRKNSNKKTLKERINTARKKLNWLGLKVGEEVYDFFRFYEYKEKKGKLLYSPESVVDNLRMAVNAMRYASNNINGNHYWAMDKNGEYHKTLNFTYKTLINNLNKAKLANEFDTWLVAREANSWFEGIKDLTKRNEEIENEMFNTDDGKLLKQLENEFDYNKKTINKLVSLVERNQFNEKISREAYEDYKDTFKEEARMFDKLINENVSLIENSRIIDKNTADKFRGNVGRYAPLKRAMYNDVVGEDIDKDYIGEVRPDMSSLKAMHGGTQPILSPLISSINNHIAFTKAAHMQRVNNLIYENLINHPDVYRELFETAELTPIPSKDGGIQGFKEQSDNSILIAKTKEGKHVGVKIINNDIARLLKEAFTYDDIPIALKIGIESARLFKAGTTGYYLQFALINPFLDITSRITNTKTNIVPLLSGANVFYKAIADKNSPERMFLDEYYFLLGHSNTRQGYSRQIFKVNSIKGFNKRNAVQKAAKGLSKITDIVTSPIDMTEMMPRATEYIRARLMGETQQTAAEWANRVTGSFSHTGRWGGKIGQAALKMSAYTNPALQTLDMTYQALKTKRGAKAFVITSGIIGAMAGSNLYNMINNWSEENKKKALLALKSKTIKELSSHLYLPSFSGKEKMVQIRVPETHNFFALGVNMYLLSHYADAKYTTDEIMQAIGSPIPDQLKPINYKGDLSQTVKWAFVLMPPIMRSSLETGLNIQTYPDLRPIDSYIDLQKVPAERYNAYTSKLAKYMANTDIGKEIGISPKRFDHFLKGNVGRGINYFTGKKGAFNMLDVFEVKNYTASTREALEYFERVPKYKQEIRYAKDNIKKATKKKRLSNKDILRYYDRIKKQRVDKQEVEKMIEYLEHTKVVKKLFNQLKDIDPDKEPEKYNDKSLEIMGLLIDINAGDYSNADAFEKKFRRSKHFK